MQGSALNQGVHLSFKDNRLPDPTAHNNFHWPTELSNIFIYHYIIIIIMHLYSASIRLPAQWRLIRTVWIHYNVSCN